MLYFAHRVCLCISCNFLKAAIILKSMRRLGFETEMKCVSCEVGTKLCNVTCMNKLPETQTQVLMNYQSSLPQLLITANVVSSTLIFVTLMMEVIRSSETLLLTRATRHSIPEDGILRSHRCESLKS
jgi:hypothetical protein